MATLKSEFQDLANELIDDEFADFFPVRAFEKAGAYDPLSGSSAPTIDSVPCARMEFNESQFNGESIKVGDFKLLAKNSAFSTLVPSSANITVDVDGLKCEVVRASLDAANAVWTMQVRAL
ncbi:MAG: hypothetical protein ACPG8A_03350 [Psychrobium sp.]